ncbi:MAG: hypothetical protein HY912_02710 [Desulfomonile tiedjei]|uniref:Uncharacterized protein n=1 Tax=Desulfomonile tiedjei TaxID=2358 RepID=A0A9D6Z292_9BACT|nr:hypothetical protein [Desulfomonile tiedjei]
MGTVSAAESVRLDTRLFRIDTRSLVGSVLLGLVFVLVQQVAHRIDVLISPALVIIGGVTWATFTGLVVLLYRQPAGLITAEVAAFVAVATGLSPLAMFFIPANGLGSITYSLVSRRLPMRTRLHHLIPQIFTNLVGNACVAVGLKVVLHLPWSLILIAAAITSAAGIIGGTLLTHLVYNAVIKSGVTE